MKSRSIIFHARYKNFFSAIFSGNFSPASLLTHEPSRQRISRRQRPSICIDVGNCFLRVITFKLQCNGQGRTRTETLGQCKSLYIHTCGTRFFADHRIRIQQICYVRDYGVRRERRRCNHVGMIFFGSFSNLACCLDLEAKIFSSISPLFILRAQSAKIWWFIHDAWTGKGAPCRPSICCQPLLSNDRSPPLWPGKLSCTNDGHRVNASSSESTPPTLSYVVGACDRTSASVPPFFVSSIHLGRV